MKRNLVAKVAVEKAAFHFDRLFDYAVPPDMRDTLRPGCRVMVPFGGGNAKRQGIVMALESPEGETPLKPVTLLIDETPLLDEEMLALVRWLRGYVFCTYYDVVRLILPIGAGYQAAFAYRPVSPSPEGAGTLSDEERALFEAISTAKTPPSAVALVKRFGAGAQARLDSLCGKGFAVRFETFRRRVGDELVTMARLSEDYESRIAERKRPLSEKQRSVVCFLERVHAASVKEACYFAAVTPSVVNGLEKKGIVSLCREETLRTPYRALESKGEAAAPLSPHQQEVFERIAEDARLDEPCVGLLHGVTGSGKTHLFIRLIQQARKQGKGVILLVPEISLTPQAVERFRRVFGTDVAVIHSGLSAGERVDEYKRVRGGQAGLVIGTRSAVFSPVVNLGLVIIDEEQESTYKSDASPRFHARDVAKFRCVQRGCMLLLASATPSIDTYYAAKTGKYKYYELKTRYNSAPLPPVELIDMRREPDPNAIFSARLKQELEESLSRGEQSILLLNRRGFHTIAACMSCGEVVTCPRCSIALTYHRANGQLMCHYCGYSRELLETCEACGSAYMKFQGSGTQKCEEELRELFPKARILRMDQDTTLSKNAHEKYFLQFSAGEYDILVGTQMVAKGLDFPRVALVGVLCADQILYGGSYRGYERAFSLLTQVVGRCGRGESSGRAFIQTHTPENPVFPLAATQNYHKFYNEEILNRRVMVYPPYCDLCTVGFSGYDEPATQAAAALFLELLRQKLHEETYRTLPVKVFGPLPEPVVKVNNKFRYRIVIKCRNLKRFRQMMGGLLARFGSEPSCRKIAAFADFYME